MGLMSSRDFDNYKEIFNIPQAQIIKSLAKINDLQDPTAKMSKSASSMSGVIELLDAPEVTLKKFKSSVTDDGKEVKFDEKGKPGISNLLTIHSALSGKSIEAIESDPRLQALITKFDGQLDRASIAPLDS